MDDKEFNEKYEQLKNSKFLQQEILGWRPVPTISAITVVYISIGVFFIVVGIIILVFTSQIDEIKVNYTEYKRNWKITQGSDSDVISMRIDTKMKKPIMIYYQIDGFTQNHKKYMNSKSDKQLKGEKVEKDDLLESGECDNMITNKDMSVLDGNENVVAIPCGLMAKSYFLDTFTEWKLNGASIDSKIRTNNTAYKSDIEKYKNPESGNWTDIEDERFILWMRPSPFNNPRKLWGVIEEDIQGTISVKIEDKSFYNYNKYIILSTRNVFGGKSVILGTFYIVFGVLSLIASITFLIAFNAYHKQKKI